MKRFLLRKGERLRCMALLMLSLSAFSYAKAELSSDEISAAVLVEGSVPVKWTNDAEHPWILSSDSTYIRTPEVEGSMTTTLECTYESSYPTEITLTYQRYYYWYDQDYMTMEVDGELKATWLNYSWETSDSYIIPEGKHTVKFTSTSTHNNESYWAGIKNLRIWECKELESACLKEGSLPLTFENDPDNMWITEDGYIRSNTERMDYISSSFSTKFTIDKPSMLSFEWLTSSNNTSSNYKNTTTITIDGVYYTSSSNTGNWKYDCVVLIPGTHTVEFENYHNRSYSHDNHEYSAWTEIRNIYLHQNWYDVTLNNPGELGTRLTQALEGKPIQDMELLKIKGTMNSDDWASIKLLTGIKGIDLKETGITSIPESACKDLSFLCTVILPETLTEIGNQAFMGTNFYQISIPASVKNIGSEVWSGTPLRYIDFTESSQLNYIGSKTFFNTRIIEFHMPDSVETLGLYYNYGNYTPDWSSLFSNCTSLEKTHLSNGLKNIPKNIFYDCTSLTEVNIPANVTSINEGAFQNTNLTYIDFPETLTYIGERAFYNSGLESITLPKNVTGIGESAFSDNKNLKTVNLNSHCWDMKYNFAGCTALEKVVLPCATPPTISSDPFSGVTKSQVTLVVPDFAFDTYRSNSYWYQFTNTIKGDEASINDYWSIRGTLNLNSSLVMQGNPSVEMMSGSKLALDSNSTQTFNEFTYNTGESSPTVVLSQSNSVKANGLISKFYVSTKDKWFFFSPLTDVNMADVTYSPTDSWVIRYYDGARRASEDAASGNWVNVPSDGTLKSGQGYIIQARETGWLSLPAASTEEHNKFFGANAVTFELADNACETEANAGWNFVANPYPTYYDIYYINMQAPITVWNGSTYRAYSLNDGDRGDDTFVLRPMQPFFVQKSAETPDLSTGMPLVGRQINTTIDRSRAPRPVVVDENRHKLNLEIYCNDNEEADDYTRVVINERASLAYETVRDASKFMSMDANVAQLYTLGDNNHPMAINERPYEDGNVALGVLLPATDRTYRFAVQRADRKAWLYDAETGIEFDITEGDYIFSASKAGIDNSRFSIRFAPAVTSVDGVESAAVKVAGNVGSISVTAPAGATVAVFATDGSIIVNTVAENGNTEIVVSASVYVVKVNGESFKTIVK